MRKFWILILAGIVLAAAICFAWTHSPKSDYWKYTDWTSDPAWTEGTGNGQLEYYEDWCYGGDFELHPCNWLYIVNGEEWMYQQNVGAIFPGDDFLFMINGVMECDSLDSSWNDVTRKTNCSMIQVGGDCDQKFCRQGYIVMEYVDYPGGAHGQGNNYGFGVFRIDASGVATQIWKNVTWVCDKTWGETYPGGPSECETGENRYQSFKLYRNASGYMFFTYNAGGEGPEPYRQPNYTRSLGLQKTWNNTVIDSVQIYGGGSRNAYDLAVLGSIDYYSVDVPCVENWVGRFLNLTGCLANDTYYQMILYNDTHSCGTKDSLPSGNGTVSALPCNYCSENIQHFNGSWGGCLPDNKEYQAHWYVDLNYGSCCAITGLLSDCHIDGGSYDNYSVNRACNFCSEDLWAYYTAWSACSSEMENRTRYFIDRNFADCCDITHISSDCHILASPYNQNLTYRQPCHASTGGGGGLLGEPERVNITEPATTSAAPMAVASDLPSVRAKGFVDAIIAWFKSLTWIGGG